MQPGASPTVQAMEHLLDASLKDLKGFNGLEWFLFVFNYYFLDFGSKVGSYFYHRVAEVRRDLWAQNAVELTYASGMCDTRQNELPNSPWVCACAGALVTWLPWGILATAEGCLENGVAAGLSFCSSLSWRSKVKCCPAT